MFALETEGSVAICWQRESPTPEEARQQIETIGGVADEHGDICLMVVIESVTGPPSAATRQEYKAAADGKGRVRAIAIVVLQKGVVGGLVRTGAKAILLLVTRKKPVKLFGDVGKAARWLASQSGTSGAGIAAMADRARSSVAGR